MRKIFILIFAFALLNCSDEETQDIQYSFDDIVGTWKLMDKYRTLDPDGKGEREDRLFADTRSQCADAYNTIYDYTESGEQGIYTYYDRLECHPDTEDFVDGKKFWATVRISDNVIYHTNDLLTYDIGEVYLVRDDLLIIRETYVRNEFTPTEYNSYTFNEYEKR